MAVLVFLILSAISLILPASIAAGPVEAISVCSGMATQQWYCNSWNTSASCITGYQCDWQADKWYTGVAYKSGGFDNAATFVERLDCHNPERGAGSHNGVAVDCVTGVDCSGLVSLAWGLGCHHSTHDDCSPSLHQVSLCLPEPSWLDMGDILIASGSHTVMIERPIGSDQKVYHYEAGGGIPKVHYDVQQLSEFEGYYPQRCTAWAVEGSIVAYCGWDNNNILWKVEAPLSIQRYEVQAVLASGEWQTVASVQGGAQHAYTAYGLSPNAEYRVVAFDRAGTVVEMASVDAAMVAGKSNSGLKPIARGTPAINENKALSAEQCLIIAPNRWFRVTQGLAHHMREDMGIVTWEYYVPDTWAYYNYNVDPDIYRYDLKSIIDSYASQGITAVMIIGDFSDWREMFTERAEMFWTPGSEWEEKLDQYIASCGYSEGQRENDIIPTWIVKDEEHSAETPYYYTDWPYADITGDQLPDISIGRLPVHSENELSCYIDAIMEYNDGPLTNGNGRSLVMLYDGRYDNSWVARQYITESAASLLPVLGLGGYVAYGVRSTIYGEHGMNYKQAFARLWMQVVPTVLVAYGTTSTRYDVARGIDETTLNMTSVTHPAIVVSGSCSGAGYAKTEIQEYGRPMCERALLESMESIVWIGPTSDTYSMGNRRVIDRLISGIVSNPGQSIGRSVLLAVRGALAEDAYWPNVVRTARSYQLLGCPVISARNSNEEVVSDIDDSDDSVDIQVWPNPSNPRSDIRIVLGTGSRVEVAIYDAMGRKIRRLMNEYMEWMIGVCGWDLEYM